MRYVPAGAVVVLIVAWYIVAGFYPAFLVPDPTETLQALLAIIQDGSFAGAVLATLYHLLVSFALAGVVGIILGVAMGRVALVEAFFKNIIPILQTLPRLITVTLAIIFLKMTDRGVIFVGLMAGLPFVVVGVWQATRNMDANLMEMARVYGHSERSLMRRVVLPGVVPDIISALRVTMGVLWHAVLVSEFIMGQKGLGRQISMALTMYNIPAIFAWGVVVVLFMVLTEYVAFRPLETRLLRWKRRAELV